MTQQPYDPFFLGQCQRGQRDAFWDANHANGDIGSDYSGDEDDDGIDNDSASLFGGADDTNANTTGTGNETFFSFLDNPDPDDVGAGESSFHTAQSNLEDELDDLVIDDDTDGKQFKVMKKCLISYWICFPLSFSHDSYCTISII